jgi:hypothetical protein
MSVVSGPRLVRDVPLGLAVVTKIALCSLVAPIEERAGNLNPMLVRAISAVGAPLGVDDLLLH